MIKNMQIAITASVTELQAETLNKPDNKIQNTERNKHTSTRTIMTTNILTTIHNNSELLEVA